MNPPTTPTTSARLDWADAGRGLAMIAVVIGHTPAFAMTKTVALFYLFHVPVFFLIAGMFQKPIAPGQTFWVFAKAKARRRLVPYFLYASASVLLYFWATRYLPGHVEVYHDTGSLVRSILQGGPDVNVALWFLACLFCAELLVYPLLKLKRVHGVLVAVGFMIVLSLPWADPNGHAGFFKIGVAFVALPFLLLGFHLRDWLQAFSRSRPSLVLGTAAVCVGLLWLLAPKVACVNMMCGIYRQVPWFYPCALIGTALTLCLGWMLRDMRWLRLIGTSTMAIFPLHLLFRPFILVDVRLFFHGTTSEPAQDLIEGVVLVVLMIVFPLGLAQLARTLARRLGKVNWNWCPRWPACASW